MKKTGIVVAGTRDCRVPVATLQTITSDSTKERKHNIMANGNTQTFNLESLSEKELDQLLTSARKIKTAKKKSEKYAKFEPLYSAYRKSVIDAKVANDLKKKNLAELKAMGFGKKAVKVKTGKKS